MKFRRWSLTKPKNAGSNAVEVLVQSGKTMDEAQDILQYFLDTSAIAHCGDQQKIFRDGYFFYRFLLGNDGKKIDPKYFPNYSIEDELTARQKELKQRASDLELELKRKIETRKELEERRDEIQRRKKEIIKGDRK
jgi:hypothetical protein